MLFYQQTATVQKGLGVADLRAGRRETLIGALASQGLMAAIVVAAAAAGTPAASRPAALLDGASAAALPEGLVRLAQGPSGALIAVGLVGSGLLALVVISLAAAWAWSELAGWPHSLDLSPRRAPGFYAVYLLEVIPAACLVLLAPNLLDLAVNAMILNVVVLAVPLGFLVRLSSDRALLGSFANSRPRAIVLWVVTGGLLAIGLVAAGQTVGPLR